MILSHLKRTLRSQRGFTIVEMLTVLMVIGVLLTLILVNTQTGNRRQELRDNAAQFVNLARNIEGRAGANEPVGGSSRKAYGICITSSRAADSFGSFPNSRCVPPGTNPADAYQLYARTLADTTAHPQLETPPFRPDILQSQRLPRNFIFSDTGLYIDFLSPLALLFVNGGTTDRDLLLRYTGSGGCTSGADCRTIRIRPKAGAIYVR